MTIITSLRNTPNTTSTMNTYTAKHTKEIFSVSFQSTKSRFPKAFPVNTLTPLACPSVKYAKIKIISKMTAFVANTSLPIALPALANRLLMVNKHKVRSIRSVLTFIMDRNGFTCFSVAHICCVKSNRSRTKYIAPSPTMDA